jgi:microcystin-dependent protein
MSDPFIAEIVMFAGNFAPRSWAFCDGQLLAISQNSAMFSLLGTTFGGDGRVTFGLPDLRSRMAMHPGSGPGLSTRRLGEKGGVQNITQPPAHTHTFNVPCNTAVGNTDSPQNAFPAMTAEDNFNSASTTSMGAGTTASTGQAGGVNVVNPFTCVNFIIATAGTFPSRN